jgi:hypothetical protein
MRPVDETKVITLNENIERAKNLVLSIKSLTNPQTYYGFGREVRKANGRKRQCLRNTIKNLKRLTEVISKQCQEGARDNFQRQYIIQVKNK